MQEFGVSACLLACFPARLLLRLHVVDDSCMWYDSICLRQPLHCLIGCGAVAASLSAGVAVVLQMHVRLAAPCTTMQCSLLLYPLLLDATAAASSVPADAHNTHCLQMQPWQSFRACSTGAALVEIYLNWCKVAMSALSLQDITRWYVSRSSKQQ
jgi:hypothetical protein